MKDLTARKLIELLEALPDNQKNVPLLMCGGQSAECDFMPSAKIEDDGLVGSIRGPHLMLVEDW